MGNVGRPRKEANLRLVTLDQAVTKIKEHLMEKYANEGIVEKRALKKKTLYNYISLGKIKNYGDKSCALVDLKDVYSLVS